MDLNSIEGRADASEEAQALAAKFEEEMQKALQQAAQDATNSTNQEKSHG